MDRHASRTCAGQSPHRIVDLAIRNARVRIGYRERSHIMSPVEFVQLDLRDQLDVISRLARVSENPDDAEYLLGQLSTSNSSRCAMSYACPRPEA
jgi:hypothetical protein